MQGEAGPALRPHTELLEMLIAERFASRLFQRDASLWGADAASEARERLGWVDAANRADTIVREAETLRKHLRERGVDRIVLSGMGGSSLAPESMTHHDGVPLVLLDSTHPGRVAAALADPARTALVVSSKSGSTVETRSHLASFEAAFSAAGIDAAERIIVVTDPGSQLEADARSAGYRVFLADPNVGGRYSALTAFGLVPSVLAGVDGHQLIDDARHAAALLNRDTASNPGLQLAAALAAQLPQTFAFTVSSAEPSLSQLGAWVEQLVAESTGKHGRGMLPIHVPDGAPETRGNLPATALLVEIASGAGVHAADGRTDVHASAVNVPTVKVPGGRVIRVIAPLGAQLLIWSVATVALCRLIGVNPFDQPDVESAKVAARAALEQLREQRQRPATTQERSDARTSSEPGVTSPAHDATQLSLSGTWEAPSNAWEALRAALENDGYIAIHAYLDTPDDAVLGDLRDTLAERCAVPVSLGYGPRFLHSTGQLHKGGPQRGLFLQIVDPAAAPLDVPGAGYCYADLMSAQAQGDREVLTARGRTVITVQREDLAELLQLVQGYR